MFILKYKKIFLSISALVVLISLFSIFSFGLKKSIDFTGGTKVVVETENIQNLQNSLSEKFGEVKVVENKDREYQITLRTLNDADYAKLTEDLKLQNATVKEFSVIGPSISSEIVSKSIWGVVLVSLCIILFITFTFFSVSQTGFGNVSSFKYGLITIIALVHDIIIPTGVFAWLGYSFGIEVDALFVVALLTILGVSVSDTIVVFDRVRENLKSATKGVTFEHVVGKSLEQSFVRSLATSVSVILVLLCLVFFGPDSTKYFALTLTIGMFVGTYSSLFVASPLLVWANEYFKKEEVVIVKKK